MAESEAKFTNHEGFQSRVKFQLFDRFLETIQQPEMLTHCASKVARSIDFDLKKKSYLQNFITLHESRDMKGAIFALFLAVEKLFFSI